MALINCPECGKEISDKSEKCIHCGFPVHDINSQSNPQRNGKRFKYLVVFLWMLTIISIIALGYKYYNDYKIEEEKRVEEERVKKEKATEEELAKMRAIEEQKNKIKKFKSDVNMVKKNIVILGEEIDNLGEKLINQWSEVLNSEGGNGSFWAELVIKAFYKEEGTINVINNAKENIEQISTFLNNFSSPGDEYNSVYEDVKDCCANYVVLANSLIDLKGSFVFFFFKVQRGFRQTSFLSKENTGIQP